MNRTEHDDLGIPRTVARVSPRRTFHFDVTPIGYCKLYQSKNVDDDLLRSCWIQLIVAVCVLRSVMSYSNIEAPWILTLVGAQIPLCRLGAITFADILHTLDVA